MDEVGLREMRQNASELVRRAEAGERLTITVAGRPAADDDWEPDRELVDASPVDPWEPR